MSAADTVQFLKQISLLAGLPNEGLIDLAVSAHKVTYQSGQVIMAEGEEGDSLLVITSGEADVIKGYGSDVHEIIANRGPGDVIGEMSLLEGEPRFATVVARGPVEALKIPFQTFVRAIGSNYAALRQMLAVMSRKLRQAQQGRYEDLRRRHEELAGLASLQQAFLAVCRHEIMTPVANAQMAMEVLKRAARPDSVYDPELLAALERSLSQAEQRVRAIVDYAGLIEGQAEMFLQVMDFKEAARQAVAKIKSQAGIAKVTLEIEVENDDPLWIPGDRNRIIAAMIHLLDNGIKFNRPGQATTVSVWGDNRWVYYEVADLGQGIAPDRLTQVWQPFVQMSSALQRGLEGMGLGLALTQYIVRAHEGEVWGESEVGRGSRFGFRLPRQTG